MYLNGPLPVFWLGLKRTVVIDQTEDVHGPIHTPSDNMGDNFW